MTTQKNDPTQAARDSDYGCSFCFQPMSEGADAAVARAVVAALEATNFSGRCEYYSGPFLGGGPQIVAAVALVNLLGKRNPSPRWWEDFKKAVVAALPAEDATPSGQRGELTPIDAIRRDCPLHGVVAFADGKPFRLLTAGQTGFLQACAAAGAE